MDDPLSPPPEVLPPASAPQQLEDVSGFAVRTPEKKQASAASSSDDGLLQPADPNLSCGVCLNLFVRPVRTPCG